MRKHLVTAFILFLTAGMLTARAQRFDLSTEEKVYTAQEKKLIEECLAAEKRYAGLEPSGTFQEGDFGSGLEVRKFREHLSPETLAHWEKGLEEMKGMKAADVPAEYAWTLPDGKKDGDDIMIEKGAVNIVLPNRAAKDYNAMVSRASAHGYTLNVEKTAYGGMQVYEARNAAGEKCTVALMNGNLMLSFEK